MAIFSTNEIRTFFKSLCNSPKINFLHDLNLTIFLHFVNYEGKKRYLNSTLYSNCAGSNIILCPSSLYVEIEEAFTRDEWWSLSEL